MLLCYPAASLIELWFIMTNWRRAELSDQPPSISLLVARLGQ
jgi:hypothetical protein